ncbi:MAG: PKD domain-containing protein [bacterium]|nr:PKD domain-containing protein [bacterium]
MKAQFRNSSRMFVPVILAIIFLIGCSSGGNNPLPVVPGVENSNPEMTGASDVIAASVENSHYLLAYGLIYIDPENPDGPKVEVIPVRAGEIHLNILKLLEDGPCTNCFKVVGFNFTQPGYLDVDIEIDHPFDDLTYSVFDVRAIMMFQGSHQFPEAWKKVSDPSLGDGALLNPDGYTALYNGSTTTAPVGIFQKYYPGNLATSAIPDSDINGYKYFITDNPANVRNAFFADSSDVQTFSLKLPTGPFVLGYAVDANWWIPISEPVDDPLTDFDSNANVAAWLSDGSDYSRYEVTVSNTKLAPIGDYLCLVGVEANENDPVGKPWLDLTAYAVQPLTVVEKVTQNPVAVAEADVNPQTAGLPIHFSGTDSYDPDGGGIVLYEWDWDNDGIYDETGPNAENTWVTPGTYPVQLRVTDDEDETDTLDASLDIIITANPVAVAEADPLIQTVNLPISFSGSGSYDPDGGTIQLYEWDWNNDGTYDETGENVDHAWASSGNYLVQLRVTDDETQTDTLDTPLEIFITENPVAVAEASQNIETINIPISFSASDSYDPDGGTILLYEWDWDNDGVFDQLGENVDHTWSVEGTYPVQLRVTDDELETDVLDVPLEIIITPDFNPVDMSPPWLNFSAKDVCADVNYAYIAAGVDGLHIIDISIPTNPVWATWVDTPDEALGVAVSGGYAYVADGDAGLQVIDIDPLGSASIVQTVDTPGKAEAVAVDGNYAYVADGASGLQIINITDPESAYIYYPVDTPGYAKAVALSGSYAYVADDSSGLQIIDVDPPAMAFIQKSVDTPGYARGVAVSGGYAYVPDWHFGFQVIDVDPVITANIVTTVDTPGASKGVAISGNYACVGDGALQIFDITVPGSAYIFNTVDTPGISYEVAISGDYACLAADFAGLQMVNINPPGSAYIASAYDTPGGAFCVTVSDGYAYVGAGASGLQIIDVDPPDDTYIVNAVATPDYPHGVVVSGGYAYVADYDFGLQIIDIDPPGSAYILNSVPTPTSAEGIAVSGGYAYIANEDFGLQIIDIDPPESAYIINTVATPGYAVGVAASGGYAYVADSSSGLQIIDIEPPESAYIFNAVATVNSASGVTVSGGYAYVVDYDGLLIMDVEPPETAYLVNTVDTPGHAVGVAIFGGNAYVADDNTGLQIIDVIPPDLAYIVNSIDTPGNAHDVAVSGQYAFVADEGGGLRIIRLWW